MAELTYGKRYVIYNYSTEDLTEVPLSGELRYYTTVITGQKTAVHIIGDGSSAANALPFVERVEIHASANVDLEELRISGARVKIYNSSASSITVQTGTTASPTTENLNTKSMVLAFFDGTYWRIEDGNNLGDVKFWYPTFNGGSLSLPWGWSLFDGVIISDIESPFNGATPQDINGDGRFVRSGDTAGTEQADALQGHKFQPTNTWNVQDVSGGFVAIVTNIDQSGGSPLIDNIVTDGVNGTPRIADETRPINITMVLIIKIK